MITAESTVEKSVEQGSRRSLKHAARYAGAVAVTSLAAIFATSAGGGSKLERSTVDRPDDITGEQVHFIYATPNDRANLLGDTDGQAKKVIDEVQSFLSTRGEQGLGLRVDAYKEQPDISYFPLKQTQAEIMAMGPGSSGGPFLLSIIEQVRGRFNNPNKNYQVFLGGDTPGAYCDPGRLYGHKLGVTYLNKAVCDYTYNGVNTLPRTIVKNIVATEGYPRKCAANFVENGLINDPADPFDLLAAKTPSEWWKTKLDANHNDYLHAPNCPGIERSGLMSWPLNSAKNGNGTITYFKKNAGGQRTPATLDPGNRLPGGSNIEAEYIPVTGEKFIGWSGDCNDTRARVCEFLVDKVIDIQAKVEKTTPSPLKEGYRLTATSEGPGQFEWLKKLRKQVDYIFKKSGALVVLKLVPDNKNSALKSVSGCDNQQLGKSNVKKSGICYEKIDHKLERIKAVFVKVPVISKFTS